MSVAAAIDWPMLSGHVTDQGQATCVNVVSQEALLADLEGRLVRKQGFSIATLNLDHVVKLRSLPAFAEAYKAHTHVTADGNPIVWLLRLAGQRVALVPGSELVVPVATLAARQEVPVGFFGSDDGSLAAAEAALKDKVPGLEVAARIAPPMGFDPVGPQADALIAELQASGARVVFLALGAPKQEILAARIQSAFPEIGVLSIGAGLDFLAGSQTRAPVLVQKLAMEWVWRLLQNPGRLWRRYLACITILPGLAASAMRLRYRQER
ncbi:WecB/TagA/CpsF family glycosyltransferase [Tropicimonas sp. S265A]|uniref:WecB/TagA/CpsF family glycosyltransferase n=1 Tax=Tropicimonas sp. S265A TaxID=3415134 RepID=UPI003C7D3ADD